MHASSNTLHIIYAYILYKPGQHCFQSQTLRLNRAQVSSPEGTWRVAQPEHLSGLLWTSIVQWHIVVGSSKTAEQQLLYLHCRLKAIDYWHKGHGQDVVVPEGQEFVGDGL